MAATTAAAAAALLAGKAAMRPAALAARKAAAAAATPRDAWQTAVLLAGRRAFSQDAAAQATGKKADPSKVGEVVVVTSGKGGVGKTTTTASFAFGLASRGHRTVAIDFDIGLRNLDLHFGMERRVVFDFVNVIRNEATVGQSLIRDRRCPNLYLLAASQTRDKTALTEEGVARVLDELRQSFDYIICDSPAGIESGAHHAMYFADRAIICTNPEVSSVRDSDKMLGILNSKSFRAAKSLEQIDPLLLVTRYHPERVAADAMLSLDDITEMLGIPCVGVIPESPDILTSVNMGQPVILLGNKSTAAMAYDDFVRRFLGEDVPMRFLTPEKKGLFSRILGR